jgi:hypothetical protein
MPPPPDAAALLLPQFPSAPPPPIASVLGKVVYRQRALPVQVVVAALVRAPEPRPDADLAAPVAPAGLPTSFFSPPPIN